MNRIETGTFQDEFPYLRAGTGEKPLVVVPGIDDSMFPGQYTTGMGWLTYWYFGRFVDEYSIYVISRPRGLPRDWTIGDMADGYATVIADELGRADVLGVSMGGLIALELAIRQPNRVDRLALANSGYRIADLDAVDRFRGYALDHDWGRIRAELSAMMFTDWRSLSYPPLAMTVGRFVLPKPADPDDVVVSLDAVAVYDAIDRLVDVQAPTLVFGGTDDPLFPRPVLETTAAGIPRGELSLVDGGKHAAFHERKPTFDRTLSSFLTRASERPVESVSVA